MSTKCALLLCGLLSVSFFGCAAREPRADEPGAMPKTRAVIFLPGYYGSALRDPQTERRVFITAREALFGHESVSLFQRELQTPPGPELVVDGVLGGVSVIPGIYSYDVYERFVERLRLLPDTKIVVLAYDWRKDLLEAVKTLDTQIRSLEASGINEIDIVAHSMGGMVATYYLAHGTQEPDRPTSDWRGADHVHKVVLLGTPFRGLFGIFRNMQRGAPLGWNDSLLPSEAVSSFPSSYALLPFDNAQVVDAAGHFTPFDVGSILLWRDLKLGLLKKRDLPPEILLNRDLFTAKQLARAASIARAIRLEGQIAPPPATFKILSVVGTGRRTAESAFFLTTNGEPEFVFDTEKPTKRGLDEGFLFADGDGTVSQLSGKLPAIFNGRATYYESHEAHAELFGDPEVLAQLRSFLLN
jgi:pimeloyl-ACP methyl ester carboxylesterase